MEDILNLMASRPSHWTPPPRRRGYRESVLSAARISIPEPMQVLGYLRPRACRQRSTTQDLGTVRSEPS